MSEAEPSSSLKGFLFSRRGLLLIAVIWVIADQVTKVMADNSLVYGEITPAIPFLDFLLSYNRGAAFSFLHDSNGWQRWLLTGISLVVSVMVLIWILKAESQKESRLMRLALAFILGGAVGNLIDRALQGYVVDFISVHWGVHRFATFNIADSAISVGAALLVLEVLFFNRKES